jgi:hypothetical protein
LLAEGNVKTSGAAQNEVDIEKRLRRLPDIAAPSFPLRLCENPFLPLNLRALAP